MTIRRLRPKDIPAVAAIIQRNYSRRYARLATAELQEMFGQSCIKPLYFVAECDGGIVGVAGCMQSWMDYHVYTIFWVNVVPEKQRQGIGKALLAKILEVVRKRGASLALLTTSVPTYYARQFGFRPVARFWRKNGHQLMALPLEHSHKRIPWSGQTATVSGQWRTKRTLTLR